MLNNLTLLTTIVFFYSNNTQKKKDLPELVSYLFVITLDWCLKKGSVSLACSIK